MAQTVKNLHAEDLGSIPGLERSPGGGHGNPLQYSCSDNPHGQWGLGGYSPQGHKESDTTEWLSRAQHSTDFINTFTPYLKANIFFFFQLCIPMLRLISWFLKKIDIFQRKTKQKCSQNALNHNPAIWKIFMHETSFYYKTVESKCGCRKYRSWAFKNINTYLVSALIKGTSKLHLIPTLWDFFLNLVKKIQKLNQFWILSKNTN